MEAKATDFRCGNLIDTPKGYQKIIDVLCDGVNTENFNSLNYDWVEPIPLTEEILLKCGFESGGAKQYLFITLDKKDECYLFFNPLGKGIAIDQDGKECSYEIDLIYLHQLQNLYFALTNEELTINL